MDVGIISRRYATALADCAMQRNEEERAYDEAGRLLRLMTDDSHLSSAVGSPIIGGGDKLAILLGSFGSKPVCSSLADFMKLVVSHRREAYLHFMLASFCELCKERRHIHEATLTTAAPVDDALLKRIDDFARRIDGGEVQIHQEVRPELVGGFIFRIGDLMIDASISTQIARLKRAFSQTTNRIV